MRECLPFKDLNSNVKIKCFPTFETEVAISVKLYYSDIQYMKIRIIKILDKLYRIY